MSMNSSVAQPYARAIFEFASESSDMPKWSDFLAWLEQIVMDPQAAEVIENPLFGRDEVLCFLRDVCDKVIFTQADNLLRLLVHNRRLSAVGAIRQRYEELRAEAEKRLEVEVISAQPIADSQMEKLRQALEKRLERQITINVSTDETLMGGAIVRADDLVIDGSIKGRLKKLSETLVR